ncbi:MAG: flagellar assembly protein FliH [Holophagaceae bacterium]|nr:flagellar assembly protein FliH [Holophagaceae bacterium]
MSPDVRFISAKDIDVNRIKSYPYPAATILPTIEEILPQDGEEADEPLGAAYSETPEEIGQRLKNANQIIAEKLAQAEQAVAEKLAQAEQLAAEKLAQATAKYAEAEQSAIETGQKAYEEGYASGEKEGHAFAESQYKVHLARLEDSLEALSKAASLINSASGDEVLALVTVMAEYLACQQIENAVDSVNAMLRTVLEAHPFPLPESASQGEPAAIIFMHPKDLEQIQDSFATNNPGIRLAADTDLSRGGFKLETADTVLDATFEKRRERLLGIVTRLMEEGQV